MFHDDKGKKPSLKTRPVTGISGLSTGEKTGCVLLPLAGLLFLFFPFFSCFLLMCFLVMCFITPFIPCSGFYLPVICRGNPKVASVALTFDDGPDPLTTPGLLELLSKHKVTVTFFVTGKKAEQYPHLIESILSHGHDIGNHTYSHDPLMMLRRMKALKQDIAKAQDVLKNLGVVCYAFRPPVGITNPLLGPALNELGLFAVNFSCRPGDFGNRRLKGLSGKIMKKVKPGDIILMHDTRPSSKDQVRDWLGHVEAVILGLRGKELGILPLDKLIGRPAT